MIKIKISEKEEIELKPVVEGMTYDNSCWIAINTKSDKKCEIVFFNPSESNDTEYEDLEKFSDFAEGIFENDFEISSDGEVQTDINENKCTKSGCDVTQKDDCDEERSWKYLHAEAQIIDIYKNKNIEEIINLVEEAKKDLQNLENNAKDNMEDTILYQKDPYAYYGVSRSDFY